jgi:hypothetical protein
MANSTTPMATLQVRNVTPKWRQKTETSGFRAMMSELSIKTNRPQDCSSEEIAEFMKLVLAGDQVQAEGLKDLVMSAQLLGFARLNDALVSIAAIKTPRAAYRGRVFQRAGSLVDPTEFTLEFGWAYTQPEYEGRGFGSGLAGLLLEEVSTAIFATTGSENSAMRHILERKHFSKWGDPFEGRIEPKVLYIRSQNVSESHSSPSSSNQAEHMVVILVHWLIRPGSEEEFKSRWNQMTIGLGSGLYREILTELDPEPVNPKFHTFSLGDPFYSTFINIGIWKSVEHFDRAVGKYIPEAQIIEKDGKQKYSIELEGFEFKLRERVVLKVISDRGGQLPNAKLPE